LQSNYFIIVAAIYCLKRKYIDVIFALIFMASSALLPQGHCYVIQFHLTASMVVSLNQF